MADGISNLCCGRQVSSILGVGPDSAFLNNDRLMRRLGMVYGAKNRWLGPKGPVTKDAIDAYTAGVNSYMTRYKIAISRLNIDYSIILPNTGQI